MQEGGKGEKRNFNDASSDGLAKIAKNPQEQKQEQNQKQNKKSLVPN